MILLFWSVAYTLAGLIVLASIPALRVTFLNLVAFVIGALIGSEMVSIAYGWYRGPLDNYPDTIHLVGALAGGTLLVWLKMRFVKTRNGGRLV